MTKNPETAKKAYDKLTIRVNRLRAQKARLQTRVKKQASAQRKARTRTLIQLGGLLELSGFSDWAQIHLGEDLQTDAFDKACTLLGLLTTLFQNQDFEALERQREHLSALGQTLLKKRASSEGEAESSYAWKSLFSPSAHGKMVTFPTRRAIGS